ncbi:MAG: cupredoxin domain-containing protein [Gemmatimonadaceae bacterium]|nr:cupredoxin domain-containing protein [Gemmatimonadaceae bacterium]
MRFIGSALVASAIVLGACGGGEKAPEGAATADTAAVAAPAAAAAATPGAAAPITGTTHEIKMVGDDKGYRFEPANLTIKAGDGVKFVMVTGGPHNVAFDGTTLAADVKAQLDANFGTERMAELSSNMKMNAGESITISFGGIKAGKYAFNCTPHRAMTMKGEITVQ